jgi:hypothetical protein
VTLTSTHQARLFEILEPLQELDPDLAASTIPRYRELSAAAWRFPYGRRSMTEQMEREAAAAREAGPPPVSNGCMDYVGSTPIEDALRTDFAQPFAIAMDEYDSDSDPDDYNEVPQQCWPSAAAFRTILYKAGKYHGLAAARYLDRIPDPALRLFAQIELAAALAGLPELGSTTMRLGPGRLPWSPDPRGPAAAAAFAQARSPTGARAARVPGNGARRRGNVRRFGRRFRRDPQRIARERGIASVRDAASPHRVARVNRSRRAVRLRPRARQRRFR